MGEVTGIEWCHHTFNPWYGCAAVSPACDGCYAKALVEGRMGGDFATRVRTSPGNWRQPIVWNRKATEAGQRRRVFGPSLGDPWDNAVEAPWLADYLALIRATPQLDWLLLTKRPQLIRRRLEAVREATPGEVGWMVGAWLAGDPPPNVWLGVTVENQAEADWRIPLLLGMPARRRFLSCEPLLGPVALHGWLPGDSGCQECDDGEGLAFPRCTRTDIPRDEQCPLNREVVTCRDIGPHDADGCPAAVDCTRETIDWIIAGGESGPGARPSHPDWHRSLREQCAAAGVPFFFKQWGEWLPTDQPGANDLISRERRYLDAAGQECHGSAAHTVVHRVGKRAARGMLDGREHHAVPA